MSDRALQISVGLSLAIHLIGSVGLSDERWTPTELRPPAEAIPVRVRLAGPTTASAPIGAPPPSVSAAPPRPEPEVSPPKKVRAEPPPNPSPPAIRETAAPVPVPEPKPEHALEAPPPEPGPTALAALDLDSASSAERIDGGTPGAAAPDRLPGPGAADEDEADRLARYVEAIRSRVQSRKRYPPLARKRAVEGRVLARVAIRADGGLTAVELAGEASPLLRRATEEAIRSAAPYPAPPAGAITIELPVEYSLHDAS